MTPAWPFLIARGRLRDYRTVLAPDLLPLPVGPTRLADALPVGYPDEGQRRIEVEHPDIGRVVVTARAEILRPCDIGGPAAADGADAVTDEHGRPLVHLRSGNQRR